MKKSPFRFTFKPAMELQREMIHHWLQQDYICEWVHGQGLQNTLSGLEKFFHHQSQHKKLDQHTEITQHSLMFFQHFFIKKNHHTLHLFIDLFQ